MSTYDPPVTTIVVRRPLHPIIIGIPAACFVGALATDVTYWRTAEMMWTNFSAWLITFGLLLGLLAAIVGLIDLIGRRYAAPGGTILVYVIGNAAVLVLAAFNMLVHTHDGWTSVVPWGLALSTATVVVILASLWVGWSMAYRTDMEVLS